eukprot:scaffold121656_cov31-Prasinocladus_malaysianus.AAC.2
MPSDDECRVRNGEPYFSWIQKRSKRRPKLPYPHRLAANLASAAGLPAQYYMALIDCSPLILVFI